MQSATPFSARQHTVRAAIQAMQATLAVAEVLLRQGHVIDLTGLDGDVVCLCDAALALRAEDGAALRDDLALLLQQATALEERMRR